MERENIGDYLNDISDEMGDLNRGVENLNEVMADYLKVLNANVVIANESMSVIAMWISAILIVFLSLILWRVW